MTEPVERPPFAVGFAGLSHLASDVSKDIEHAKSHAETISRLTPTSSKSAASAEPMPELYLPPASSPFKLTKNRVWGFALVLFLILCFWPKPEHQTSAAGSNASASVAAPAVSASDGAEDKPAMYSTAVMTANQLRYCLDESIRIDAASPRVDKSNASDLSRYNADVNDYNVRCNQRSYHLADFSAVNASVEQARSALIREGSARFTPAEVSEAVMPINNTVPDYPPIRAERVNAAESDSERFRNDAPPEALRYDAPPEPQQSYADSNSNDSSN